MDGQLSLGDRIRSAYRSLHMHIIGRSKGRLADRAPEAPRVGTGGGWERSQCGASRGQSVRTLLLWGIHSKPY